MKLTGHQIMHAVCHHTGMHPDAIRGPVRIKKVMAARKLIIERMVREGYTISRIARLLNRDHTTIAYHCRPQMRVTKREQLNVYRARRKHIEERINE
jgi:chromosomal replication initiation ATPase DnaA